MTWVWVSYEILTTCHKPVDPILWRNWQPKLDSVGFCHCGELNDLCELLLLQCELSLKVSLFFKGVKTTFNATNN